MCGASTHCPLTPSALPTALGAPALASDLGLWGLGRWQWHVTCLVVVQGPGTQPLATQLRVAVHVLSTSVLRLHLPTDGKEGCGLGGPGLPAARAHARLGGGAEPDSFPQAAPTLKTHTQ